MAVDAATDKGTDVVLSSGTSRGRSVAIVGVALLALAGAATLSGGRSNGAGVPTTATVTTEPKSATSATTTPATKPTVVLGPVSTGSTTTIAAAASRATASTVANTSNESASVTTLPDSVTTLVVAPDGSTSAAVVNPDGTLTPVGTRAGTTANPPVTISADLHRTTPSTSVPIAPRQVSGAPLLGEKTGIKLMLIHLREDASPQNPTESWRDSILDLDTGVVTRLGSATYTYNNYNRVLFPTASGVASVVSASDLSVRTWRADGTFQEFSRAGFGGGGNQAVIGDDLWMVDYSYPDPGNEDRPAPKLVRISLKDGTATLVKTLQSYAGVVGQDANNHPIVGSFDGTGSFSFDPETQEFSRITLAGMVTSASDAYVKRACDERMSCGYFLVTENGTVTRAVNDADISVVGMVLAPVGAQVVSFHFGAQNKLAADVFDPATGQHVALGRMTNPSNGSGVPQPAWSRDGKWLFLQFGGELLAWHSGLAEPIRIQLDDAPIVAEAVGVFPA